MDNLSSTPVTIKPEPLFYFYTISLWKLALLYNPSPQVDPNSHFLPPGAVAFSLNQPTASLNIDLLSSARFGEGLGLHT